MKYLGKVHYAHQRKTRERNKGYYRALHWPLWIFVFFLAPGPLIFGLFAHGFRPLSVAWLAIVVLGTGVAAFFGQLPGTEALPYILRFDEDLPNPLYRRVCYAFAWNAMLSFAALNLAGLAVASATGTGYLRQLYLYGYTPVTIAILLLGAKGGLPRVGASTRNEGIERRQFYGAVWSVTLAQTLLLILWRTLPMAPSNNLLKLVVFAATLALGGLAAHQGLLGRTRPILPGNAGRSRVS